MIAAIILAGGKATRFGGVAKHAIVVDGRTILARQLAVLGPRCGEIVVASNAPIEGMRVVGDRLIDGGPLAGVAAALAVVAAEWAIVVAGDMPYLSAEVVDRLIVNVNVNVNGTSASDAVGFRIGGLPEPLCCALRVAAAQPVVEALLAARRFRASGLLAALRVHWLDVAPGSEEAAAFRNVNSPGDLPPGSGI
jgi:molybdopterin-guanine dinucleotide biosynthesis protein A